MPAEFAVLPVLAGVKQRAEPADLLLESKQQMISDAVDAFLAGFAQVFGQAEDVRRPAVKALV